MLFRSGIEKLKQERIAKMSDRLIPKSNKIEGWDNAVVKVVGDDKWCVPARVVFDINNYWVFNKSHGFNPEKTSPILVINGEYDFEVTSGGYDVFKRMFKNFKEVIIPNSTHFSMWENNSHITRKEIIDYIKG